MYDLVAEAGSSEGNGVRARHGGKYGDSAGFASGAGKPVHVAFDGGRLTSDAGILLLAAVEQRLRIAERLAACLEDPRDPDRVRHELAEMIRYRALLIAAGYPDANDCDALKSDPAFKMAVGRLPESGADLCSQPTISRLENLPGATALKRMMAAMVELFCDSFDQVPRRILLDIDDTEDRVHGGQQLSLVERPLRQPLLSADPYLRGDQRQAGCRHPAPRQDAGRGRGGAGTAPCHRPYPRPLAGGRHCGARRQPLRLGPRRWRGASASVSATSSAWPATRCCCARSARSPRRPLSVASMARGRKSAATVISAMPPKAGRSSAASSPASRPVPEGADSRFIVTNLPGLPKMLYEKVYCARGQAENLIKAHKLHLASDRTSCRKATANQFRLLIHTAAYWLLLSLRGSGAAQLRSGATPSSTRSGSA